MQVLSTQGERTNDIARSVQNGDTDILVLWLACRRLVMQTARRWHRAFNGSRGVVLDDLEQVGFLALTKAAETWNPDSGAFSTWLTFQLKTAFAAAYFMRTERDRKDPLNDAVSLDTPPTGTDEDVMLRDIIPDAAAELAFEDVEHKDLCSAVQSAVLSLPEDQRTVIIREFWYGAEARPKDAQQGDEKPAASVCEQGIENILLTENGKKDRKCPIERGNYHRHQKTAGTGCASEQPYKGSRRPQGWNQRKDAAAVLAGRGIFDRLQTGCRRNGGRCNAPASAKSFERGHTAANDRIEQSRGNRKSDYGGTDAAGIQPEILRVQRHSEAFGGTRCTMTDSGRVCWRRCVPRLPGLRLYFRTERALGWRSIRIRLKQPSSGHRNWQHYTFAGTHRSRHRSSLSTYRKGRLHEHQRKH